MEVAANTRAAKAKKLAAATAGHIGSRRRVGARSSARAWFSATRKTSSAIADSHKPQAHPSYGASWRHGGPGLEGVTNRDKAGPMILVIDNYDSFTYNL